MIPVLDETTETIEWSTAPMPRPYRTHSAAHHHAAATRPEQYVTAERHDVVRQSLAILADEADLWPRALRRRHVAGLLADSVEKQARILALGRNIHIPRPVIA